MSPKRGPGPFDLALALAMALVVLVASHLAYDSAETRHEDGRLVGILADDLHVGIGAIYGSFAREVIDGGGLYVHNHQTSEPHAAAQARPWEWLLGKLGRLVGPEDEAAWVFHADRYLAVVIWAFLLAWLASELFATRLARGLAVVGAMTFTNLYWFVEAIGRRSELGASLRTWMDGGHSKLSGLGFGYASALLGVPHLVLELAFLCGVLASVLAILRLDGGESPPVGRRLALAVVGGLSFLGLVAVRPYTAPVAAFVVAGLMAHRVLRAVGAGAPLPRALGSSLGLGLLDGHPAQPQQLHQLTQLKGGSIFSGLDVLHLSPPLLEQAMFIGPSIPVVLGGLLLVARGLASGPATRAPWLCLILWLVAGTALTNGAPLVAWEVEAFLPMALVWLLLAALVLEAWGADRGRLPALAIGGLLLVSGLVGTGMRWSELSGTLDRRAPHLWLPAGTAALVDHLEASRSGLHVDHATPAVAIDRGKLGVLLPWLSGVRVFVGHRDHTRQWAAKAAYQDRFLVEPRNVAHLFDAGATHVASVPREGADVLAGHPHLVRELVLPGSWRLDAIQGPPGREPVPFVPGESGYRPDAAGESGGEPDRD